MFYKLMTSSMIFDIRTSVRRPLDIPLTATLPKIIGPIIFNKLVPIVSKPPCVTAPITYQDLFQ